MIKGALVFAGFGFCCRMAIWIGPKQFIFDRRIALKKPGINSIKGYGTIGALFGAASFLINDLWLYSPVESFYLRMIGHSIVFGLLFAFTYHPTTFFYGCIAGAIFGNQWLM